MARTGENIYERKDGRFEGRYISGRDEEGKPVYASIYGRTRTEVREKLKAAKQEYRDERLFTNRTFGDVAALWLEEQVNNLSPTSIPRYESALNLYALPYLKDKVVKEIDESVLDSMIVEVRQSSHGRGQDGGELKGNTLKLVQQVAKWIVEYANEKDFPRDRSAAVLPKWNSYDNPVVPLDVREQEKLCLAAKYNESPEMLAVLYAMYMGIGPGEGHR